MYVRTERSLGELLGDLSSEVTTLVHQEIALAQREMTTRVTGIARDGALVGLGGVLLHAALLSLMVTVGLVLVNLHVSPWLSALIVTVIVGAIGAILAVRGRDGIQHTSVVPQRTIETIRDDAEWAREQVR